MKLRSEVAVYDYQAVASKFTAHDTQFNVVHGKINALVSESEITTLINGGKTMYSRLATAEMTIDGISTQVSDVQTEINGSGSITGLKSRMSTVEQNVSGISTTVSDLSSNAVTTSNLVSKINQTAGQINLSVIKNSTDLATKSYVSSQITASESGIALTYETKEAVKDLSDDLSDLSDNFSSNGITKNNLVQQINLKKGEINLSVIKNSGDLVTSADLKVTNDAVATCVKSKDLVSKINQKAGEISVAVLSGAGENATVESLFKANANLIRLKTTTLTWRADNSKLLENGHFWCKSGEIAGWTINMSSISGAVTSNGVTWTTSINKPSGTGTNVFKVSDGTNTPFRVTAAGALYATKGAIAGWTIDSTSIYKTISGYTTSLSAAGTSTTGKVLYVKKDSSYPFYIQADGKLVATNADISGKITATSGSFSGTISATAGSIGNWTLSTDGIYKTVGNYEVRLRSSTGATDAAIRVRNTSSSSNTFYVTNAGKLYAADADIKGTLTSTAGNIAGFTLEKYRMKKDLGNYRMFIQGPRNDEDYHTVGETWYFSAQVKNSSGGYDHRALITGEGRIRGRALYIDTKDKNRIIKMSDGKYRKLYCVESPAPYFMDCGKGKTGAKGALYADAGYAQVTLSQYFLECTLHNDNYFVFVQPLNGSGNFYVTRLMESFRVVGTPNTEFFWQAICLTSDNDNCYLDIWNEPEAQ